ncbi:hypothetical protein V6N12_068993 [Hibiscus sabdariffa]|uniref:Uncharacterized protein n=1 Tax=Hibiscus sabdariffa TaxID=183260 RepID=A0ABR2CCE6_9ROSI
MATAPANHVLAGPYGPWMLVERKKWISCNSLPGRHSLASARSNMETMQVSKFNLVFEANDVPHGSILDSLFNKHVHPSLKSLHWSYYTRITLMLMLFPPQLTSLS